MTVAAVFAHALTCTTTASGRPAALSVRVSPACNGAIRKTKQRAEKMASMAVWPYRLLVVMNQL